MYHKLVHEIRLTLQVITVGYALALKWDLTTRQQTDYPVKKGG